MAFSPRAARPPIVGSGVASAANAIPGRMRQMTLATFSGPTTVAQPSVFEAARIKAETIDAKMIEQELSPAEQQLAQYLMGRDMRRHDSDQTPAQRNLLQASIYLRAQSATLLGMAGDAVYKYSSDTIARQINTANGDDEYNRLSRALPLCRLEEAVDMRYAMSRIPADLPDDARRRHEAYARESLRFTWEFPADRSLTLERARALYGRAHQAGENERVVELGKVIERLDALRKLRVEATGGVVDDTANDTESETEAPAPPPPPMPKPAAARGPKKSAAPNMDTAVFSTISHATESKLGTPAPEGTEDTFVRISLPADRALALTDVRVCALLIPTNGKRDDRAYVGVQTPEGARTLAIGMRDFATVVQADPDGVMAIYKAYGACDADGRPTRDPRNVDRYAILPHSLQLAISRLYEQATAKKAKPPKKDAPPPPAPVPVPVPPKTLHDHLKAVAHAGVSDRPAALAAFVAKWVADGMPEFDTDDPVFGLSSDVAEEVSQACGEAIRAAAAADVPAAQEPEPAPVPEAPSKKRPRAPPPDSDDDEDDDEAVVGDDEDDSDDELADGEDTDEDDMGDEVLETSSPATEEPRAQRVRIDTANLTPSVARDARAAYAGQPWAATNTSYAAFVAGLVMAYQDSGNPAFRPGAAACEVMTAFAQALLAVGNQPAE